MFDDAIVCCYLYTITKYGYPPPAESTSSHLQEMKQLGFRSVELEGVRKDHLIAVYERRQEIAETLRTCSLQLPIFCVVLPGLSSADSHVRKENLSLFEKGCEIARTFAAIGISDNGPIPPYEFPDDIPVVRHFHEEVLRAVRFPLKLHWPDYWRELVAVYREACDIAAHYQLSFHLHPCLGSMTANCDGFLYLFDAVARPNLRFNFDTANQFALKDNLALSLRRLAGLIDYIHLSDNRGHRIEHLPPETGAIRWDIFFETLQVIGYKGYIGIDIGGEESGVKNLDQAYTNTATWLQDKLRAMR